MRPPSDRPGAVRMTVESIVDSVSLLFDWLAPLDEGADAEAEDGEGEVIETEGEET